MSVTVTTTDAADASIGKPKSCKRIKSIIIYNFLHNTGIHFIGIQIIPIEYHHTIR